MKENWSHIYNRLFEIINTEGECYFSGGRFIAAIREVDPYFPSYGQYITERKSAGKSTSRYDYYYDIILSFKEDDRLHIISAILNKVQHCAPAKVSDLRGLLGAEAAVPNPFIAKDIWNADRLKGYLEEIDSSISTGNFERAVTLAYTSLEGFLKAFARKNIPEAAELKDISELSRATRTFLRTEIETYPEEALSMLNHIYHTVDKARNRFSESHFDENAGRWLAVFTRDLVNTEIRLLLHFM